MEKIAFISDIHSNLPALESTLQDIKSSGIERIYCLGDIIGYHSYTNEVIELIRSNGVISIKGNHDDAIIKEAFNRDLEKDFGLYWNFDKLNRINFEYLENLPEFIEFVVEGVSFKLVHGSPNSITEYIREGSKELDLYMGHMESDILICAHTHIPYIVERNNHFLLNSGSVGKPKFGKPDASYISLTIDNGFVQPEIITVPYNVSIIAKQLRLLKFPNKLIVALETGNP